MIYVMISTEMIAVVNLEPWRVSADQKTAADLVESLKRTGFAYVTGHGVPPGTVSDVFRAAHQFFSQDPKELDDVHYRHAMNYHGFVPRGITPVGLHELYDIGVGIPTGYRGPGEELLNTPNLWPVGQPGFRPAIERYQDAMRVLADSVLGAIATGLSLPPDFFAVRCAEPHAQMRLLHYLPAEDSAADENVFSVGRHCDYEALTVLAQDDVGGLQVRGPDDDWIDVQPINGALVMNAGDMLERWTNGHIPAAQHRVASPTGSDRYSVAFFYATGYDVIIEPVLPPAQADGKVYEPVTTGAFMHKRFTEEGI